MAHLAKTKLGMSADVGDIVTCVCEVSKVSIGSVILV
jgi:hypothetical protein